MRLINQEVEIQVRHNEIRFPKGYYFSQSCIAKLGVIKASEISEFNLNTNPISLIILQYEVVFLKNELEKEIENFASLNRIPITNRLDTWQLINQPFLDTEFDEEQKQQTISILEENGFSKKEIIEIRKNISKTMWKNYFVWEWIYLGLFDYLYWSTFLNKKKYKWAMEIALRNFEKNQLTSISTS